MSPRVEHQLPREIHVERLAEGVRYELPRRAIGKARWFGAPLVLMGIAVIGFGAAFVANPLQSAAEADGFFQVFLAVFVVAGLIPVAMGIGLIGLGFCIMANALRSEVEVRGGQVIAVERVGPFRWRRKRPVDKVQRMVLDSTIKSQLGGDLRKSIEASGGEQTKQWLDGLAAIIAQGDGIEQMVIAPGYPVALLHPLADEIAERIEAKAPGRMWADERAPIEVVEKSPETEPPPAEETPIEQPAKSTIDVEHTGDSQVTFTAPARGFFRGNKFFAWFSLGWLALSGTMFVMSLTGNMENSADTPAWLPPLFTGVFVLVGVGLFINALNAGKRVVIIDVVDGYLLVTQSSLFGTKVNEWPAADLKRVRVGPSNITINNRPVPELKIEPASGRGADLLVFRDKQELEWLAQQLRIALAVPKE